MVEGRGKSQQRSTSCLKTSRKRTQDTLFSGLLIFQQKFYFVLNNYGLSLKRLETPHREKPSSREVQPWSRHHGRSAIS